jgi:hypothetical protein
MNPLIQFKSISLPLLIVAVLIGFALSPTPRAQTFETPNPTLMEREQDLFSPGIIASFYCRLRGAHFRWLIIRRHDNGEHETDPSFTSIESDYKPTVRKMKNGKWEIVFRELP